VAPPRNKQRKARNTLAIVHYVNVGQQVPFVGFLRENGNRLRPKNNDQILLEPSTTKSPASRAHLARASAIFELAALERIKQQQYDIACQLLINGIRHDLIYKKTIRAGPSLRLYDLLAKLIVLHRQDQYSVTLQELTEQGKELIKRQDIGPPARRKRRRSISSGSTPPVNLTEIRRKRM